MTLSWKDYPLLTVPNTMPSAPKPLVDPLRLPARKPRRISATTIYASYRVLRRILPRQALLRVLLTASWMLNRVAYEQALAALGLEEGMMLFRPHTIPFLEEHVRPEDAVLELGSGPGLFTPTIARLAASVVCVDTDPAALAAARRRCEGLRNVSFLQGSSTAVAGEDFDTAVLLHILEHVPDPVASLGELPQRCDRALIEVPDLESMHGLYVRLRVGAPVHWDDDHRNEFTADSLTRTMAKAGWQAKSVERRNCTLLAVGQRVS